MNDQEVFMWCINHISWPYHNVIESKVRNIREYEIKIVEHFSRHFPEISLDGYKKRFLEMISKQKELYLEVSKQIKYLYESNKIIKKPHEDTGELVQIIVIDLKENKKVRYSLEKSKYALLALRKEIEDIGKKVKEILVARGRDSGYIFDELFILNHTNAMINQLIEELNEFIKLEKKEFYLLEKVYKQTIR